MSRLSTSIAAWAAAAIRAGYIRGGASSAAQGKRHRVRDQAAVKNQLVPVSCSPDALASFQPESPLPLLAGFFNAQVQDKYKADPEKYRLGHRSINCRQAWSLQTYDINEAGQVRLGNLPYPEQLY